MAIPILNHLDLQKVAEIRNTRVHNAAQTSFTGLSSANKGLIIIDGTSLKFYDGSTWQTVGTSSGTMSSFTLRGDSGTDQTIDDSAVLDIAGGTGISTVAGAPETVTVNLDEATSSVRGGIELFSDTDQSIAANPVSSTAGRTYGIQLNSSGQAVVNVPWSDTNTNTTYTAGTGIDLDGTTFNVNVVDNQITTTPQTVSDTANRYYQVETDDEDNLIVNVPWSDTDTNTQRAAGTGLSLSGNTINANVDGTQSIGANDSSETSGRTYKVQVDSSDNLVVNVPWSDTNTVYTHPTHPGDDISLDTGTLTGATVISDLNFNITTDTLGHVTDATLTTLSTRDLTLFDLGYTGDTDANNYTHPNHTGQVTSTGDGNTALTVSAITAQTDLESGLASTDELLVNDGGALKKMDVSVLQSYMQSNLTFTTNSDVDVNNANLLTRLANLESTNGAGTDENIVIGASSGDTIVITGNLQVSGTTTTIDSNTVNIGDHNIVLDSDNSTGGVVNGAGITINGNTGDDATFTYSTTGPKFELKLGANYEDLQVDRIIAANITLGGTAITSTAGEINLLDGGATVEFTVSGGIQDTDGIILNDGGTTKLVQASNLTSYVSGKTSASLTIGDGTNTTITIDNLDHGLGTDSTNFLIQLVDSNGNTVYADVNREASGEVDFTFATAPASNSIRVLIFKVG